MKKTKILFLVAVILIISIISSKYSKASSNSIEDGNTSIQVNKSADEIIIKHIQKKALHQLIKKQHHQITIVKI